MDAIELKILIGLHRVSNEIDRRTTRIVKCYGLSTVSYTHLDVYKRQGLGLGIREKAW